MSIIAKLRNAITGGEWSIGYSSLGDKKWMLIGSPIDQWCADPFVISQNNEHFIFVEQYMKSKEKGCIGYYKFIDGVPVNKGIIIENTYHMSYPDVFRYGDKFYMIPETSANETVDLYVADNFPDKWRKEKTLIKGKKYVDSTVYQDESGIYLISYSIQDGFEIHVFSIDMERKEIELLSKKRYVKNVARPAGRLFLKDGKLIRPAQDCSRKYGESLIFYQVDAMNQNGNFFEHEVKRVDAREINIEKKPDRIHHYTYDDRYQVIDLFSERTDLMHAFKIFARMRRK